MRKRLAILGAVTIATFGMLSPASAWTVSASGPIAAIDGATPAEVRVGAIAELTVFMDSEAPIRAESSNCEGQRLYWFASTAGTIRVRIATLEWTYDVRFVWIEDDAECDFCPGGGDMISFSSSDDSALQGSVLMISDCLAPYDLLGSTALPRTNHDIGVAASTMATGTVWAPGWAAVFMVQVQTATAERTWTQVKNIYR